MKSYTITVKGNVYDVTVEEKTAANIQAAPNREIPTPVAPVCAGKTQPAPVKQAGAGTIRIEAGASGKVFKIEAEAGTAVKAGDTILVLEIMKMETPVVAAQDGTVASIEVAVGESVAAGALLATMNA